MFYTGFTVCFTQVLLCMSDIPQQKCLGSFNIFETLTKTVVIRYDSLFCGFHRCFNYNVMNVLWVVKNRLSNCGCSH